MRHLFPIFVLLFAAFAVFGIASAQPAGDDIEGAQDHPALTRYPDTTITWYTVENWMPYRVPVGPVTGYRYIEDWEEVEGRVTRIFYELNSADRTHGEIYQNYREALEEAGFEIIVDGIDPASNAAPGGRSWFEVYFRENPVSGPANALVAGTATQGGMGAVFGRKERADDTIYAMVTVDQHRDDMVGILVDVVETKSAETGLVTADAEAMGKDIAEYGRTVLEGLFFDHDKATLTDRSAPSLGEIARLLEAQGDKAFYVVGHTDGTGSYDYNTKLSADRAAAVRLALVEEYGIAEDRLQAEGVGPLSPVFANASDGGREKNRRVELVEK